ncbi:MAG: PQQ-binding-like beta-propeller repeat protein [Haloarculaceae archaeon]
MTDTPDTSDWTRRRALGALGSALAVGLAGCTGSGDGTTSTTGGGTTRSPGFVSPETTAESPGSGDDGDSGDGRPTATARNPKPLDVAGAWRQVGGDPGHTGVTGASGVPADGQVYWRIRRVRSGPAVLGKRRLFHYAKLGTDRGGRPTVTRTREPDAGTAHPVYGDPHLVARDAADGTIEWAAPVPTESRSWPAVAGDRVVSAVSGRIAAHDRASGNSLWTVDLGEKDAGVPAVVGETVVVPVQGVVDGDTDVQTPSIRALELGSGDERWAVEPPKRGNAVAITGDTVVVLSYDYDQRGTLLGLAVADGSERWRATVPGGFFNLPVVAGGTVYVTSANNTVHAISAADGDEVWSRHVGGQPARPAATAETVYVAVDNRVLALDTRAGDRRWRVTLGADEYPAAIAVGSDTIYAGMEGVQAPIYALARRDGTERWRHTFPNKTVEGDMVKSGVAAQPAVADGALYVFAVDGLYAFGPA